MKGSIHSLFVVLLLFASLLCLLTGIAFGATAEETLVVVNKRMAGARDIARDYMEKRKIPKENLLVTSLSLGETMGREEYDKKLRKPIRKKIEDLEPQRKIYALVLIYGVPLKVLPPELDWDGEEALEKLKKEKRDLEKKKDGNQSRITLLADLIKELSGTDKRAAVDSELMLVKKDDYPLERWIANPYFIGASGSENEITKNDVIVVARLDGPDEKTVYRLIDDALETEQNGGLKGKVYIDARYKRPENEKVSGYAQWDLSLYKTAERLQGKMDVHLDTRAELIAPGAAPNAALYCGWYSLAQYVDSFTWNRGAVGYHIASAECSTLKKENSQVWCLQMLKRGVAATLGPVYEPYVQGFPLPELFFAGLTEASMNLGESYLISLPFISWQMVLVGDPLYTPFPDGVGTGKK